MSFKNDTLRQFWNAKIRGSKYKLKKAFASNCESITIRLTLSEDVIALTKSQLERLVKAYEEKKGMTIRMSKKQLAHNIKIEGGFLQALAELIPFLTGTVLSVLGVGALSELASTVVQKLIGTGLYLKKGGRVCQIETDREGLHLGPASGKWFETVGNGFIWWNKAGCMMVED